MRKLLFLAMLLAPLGWSQTSRSSPPFVYIGILANIPSTCRVGTMAFITNVAAGTNIRLCTSSNTWTSEVQGATTVTYLSGAGAPSSSCTAAVNVYLDTTNQDYWFCSTTNTWKKLLSTLNTGAFVLTSQNGTTPSTPAAGFVSCYTDSTSKLWSCVDDTGTVTAIGGGSDATLTTSDITTNDVTSTKHGFAPKAPADATKFLNGAATPAYAQPKDSDLSTTDITTNNATTSKHGFTPKGDNDVTHFLNGQLGWTAPAGGGSSVAPLFTATADKTVANTTSETSLVGTGVGSVTTIANYFSAGSSLKLELTGFYSSAAIDTMNIKIKAGSTVVGQTGAFAAGAVTSQVFRLIAVITCRTAGASGTFIVNTIFEETGSALTATEAKILNTSTVTLNTTGTLAWDITNTWSAASASDTITATNFLMYTPNLSSSGANVTTYTSTGANTFTKPATCSTVEFVIWGGGGSGAGGNGKATNATVTLGGTGGGGGAKSRLLVKCADLTAPIVVNVGAGGAGPAAATSGNPGGNSSVTSNGVQILFAGGGGAGFASSGTASVSGGSGGGAIGIGAIGSTGSTTGGAPSPASGAAGLSGQGAGDTLGAAGGNAEWGGGAGGGISTGGAFDAGSSIYGGPGGGAGGMVTGASGSTVGKAGGAPQSYTVAGGGAGGAACSTNTCTATNGTPGTAGSSQLAGSGGGGGGACISLTGAGSCTAGNGAAGAQPGSGGGGGGAANTNAGTSNPGTGGAGGDGYAVVIVN